MQITVPGDFLEVLDSETLAFFITFVKFKGSVEDPDPPNQMFWELPDQNPDPLRSGSGFFYHESMFLWVFCCLKANNENGRIRIGPRIRIQTKMSCFRKII